MLEPQDDDDDLKYSIFKRNSTIMYIDTLTFE